MLIVTMLKNFEKFKIKIIIVYNVNNYHHYYYLYVQMDTLLLADVFESFSNKFMKLCKLDPAHFLSPPGLTWQACLKKA